jgi:hypothetical protein
MTAVPEATTTCLFEAGGMSTSSMDLLDGEYLYLATACAGDVAPDPTDGIIGIDDFLAVLSAWGPCVAACPADFTGPGGVPDGVVGIDDFLGVLSGWGGCP